MKEETPKDSIMASWWDPGHGVTAVGERAVVADGSQNHWHIHDLALAFTSTNETESVELLKKYEVDYFFVSPDLINKFGAISFLSGRYRDSGGNPNGINYPVFYLAEGRPAENGTTYMYNVGGSAQLLLTVSGQTANAVLKQGYQTQEIARITYFVDGQGFRTDNVGNDTVDAHLFVDPSFRTITYLSQDLESNLMTELYYFEGTNMEHFELVKNFGGAIKVYKVIY
jgi:asparagine N-glycosylation enzyme membrane subunit Stt3